MIFFTIWLTNDNYQILLYNKPETKSRKSLKAYNTREAKNHYQNLQENNCYYRNNKEIRVKFSSQF